MPLMISNGPLTVANRGAFSRLSAGEAVVISMTAIANRRQHEI